MRIRKRIITIATAGLAAGAVTLATAPSAWAAARSTRVNFTNATECMLVRVDAELQHGTWTDNLLPPDEIPGGHQATWQSESSGLGTGTEGFVVYQAENCDHEGKNVRFHWDNPFVGSNHYDWEGTDNPPFHGINDTGSGNNATVNAVVLDTV